jgi:dolichol-phosphate mannosyltransferase
MYADLQEPPELIVRLYDKSIEGYDIVWANRKNPSGSFFGKLFSSFYALLMRRFVTKDFPERGFDVVMFDSKVREELNNCAEANSSLFLHILSLGFRQGYVSYDRLERARGHSKWTLKKKVKLFLDSFVVFSSAPIRFVSAAGICLSLAGFCWGGYVFLRALLFHDLAPGWPALICVLLLGFGITNISLGILAEYLWRVLDNTRNKRAFIVREAVDL